ncbi:universal stress protein [Mangrovihabitans endophyticus]|uniref:Universal stress protein n=1 Tax=Mangrovihabitans endophyticus TaxID=1751298 RepID=A0A8J3FMQ8_9ACTN|nr:universal stress protein [Mangrovihabitans endophyticus]GGK75140.1 universal stress protein [Mangrovihabitans endophyticus]
MTAKTIVVGTDGAAPSKAAVRWAAREAERQGATLRIVHAFDWDWREAWYDYGDQYAEMAEKIAATVTANATDLAVAAAPGIEVRADTMMGHAAPRLLDVAETAELMVLGSRGRGGFASLMLGSVSQQVATHARCPVVVVRGNAEASDSPVTAGVDHSHAKDRVLETAFEAAARRGAPLTVVRSYLPLLPVWLTANVPEAALGTPAAKDADAAARADLDALVSPWAAKYPGVRVETVLSHDGAAAVLARMSAVSQLVVVGSRGHGGVAGTVLGSTGLQLLHHAECPVWIAR